MLKELKRPGIEFNWKQYNNQSNVAWKTGTSYGHKDAWAVGCTPEWTVVVWVGNFDGESNVSLSGMKSAGPLFFNIMNYLPKSSESSWFSKNQANFKTIALCSETGFLAGPNCPEKKYSDVPKNMAAMKVCPYHKKIEVNEKEDHEVCSLCWDKKHHSKSYLIYPPEVNYQLNRNGVHYEKIPEHLQTCPVVHLSHNMDFIYPKDSSQIWLPRDFNGELQKVIVKLAHQKPKSTVYWYLDDSFLGTTINEHKKGIQLSSGWHQITVSDNLGESNKIHLQISLTTLQE
jgi:penicillin-binding protein 1C